MSASLGARRFVAKARELGVAAPAALKLHRRLQVIAARIKRGQDDVRVGVRKTHVAALASLWGAAS